MKITAIEIKPGMIIEHKNDFECFKNTTCKTW